MSLIRKHVAVLQAWACLALVLFVAILLVPRSRLKSTQRKNASIFSVRQKRSVDLLDVFQCPRTRNFRNVPKENRREFLNETQNQSTRQSNARDQSAAELHVDGCHHPLPSGSFI